MVTPAATTTYQFDWTAKGSFKGAPASGHGKTGSVLALQVTDRPFPVQADVRLGDSHIAFVGTLTDPLHLGALDVRLWFSGSSMSKLYAFTGITLPDTRRTPPKAICRQPLATSATTATRIFAAAWVAAILPATWSS